ncbi:MAG: hypothetical protein U0324_30810 [Polyangiales bacterium]
MSARLSAALAVMALTLAAPSVAHAQRHGRWSFGMEVGAGTMVHDFDHDGVSADTPALSVASRFGIELAGPFAVQVGGAYGRFFREHRGIQLVGWTLGARYEPRVGHLGLLRVDANAGAYIPGSTVAFGVDGGVAFEFRVGQTFSVGPFARFTHVWNGREGVATPLRPYAATASQDTSDIHWWVVGLSFTVERRPKAPEQSGQHTAPAHEAGAEESSS